MYSLYMIFKARYNALSKTLKILLFSSIFLIVLIEFFLKKYPSSYYYQEVIGVIVLQISYAFLTGFIFYYLVNFEPQVQRKIMAHKILNNNIQKIEHYTNHLIYNLIVHSNIKNIDLKNIDIKSIELACAKINPFLPIEISTNRFYNKSFSAKKFKNSYCLMYYYVEKISSFLDTIILLNDIVDDIVMDKIYSIKDCLNYLVIEEYEISYNKDMSFLSWKFTELYRLTKELNENYMKTHYIFDWEFHNNQRKINKKRYFD